MRLIITVALFILGYMNNAEPLLTRIERSIERSEIESRLRRSLSTDDSNGEPYFSNRTERNVSSQLGKTTYLRCRVKHISNRTVSWVRQKDSYILTVDLHTYVNDIRFTPIHGTNSEMWTLKIERTQNTDAGNYECHIVPDTNIKRAINLNVFEYGAEISEGPNFYVSCDSTINMTCIITGGTSPPDHVYWYHNDIRIDKNATRGGIKVGTEDDPATVSRLSIQNATFSDSGTYACRPANAAPANIQVYVLDSGDCQTNSSDIGD